MLRKHFGLFAQRQAARLRVLRIFCHFLQLEKSRTPVENLLLPIVMWFLGRIRYVDLYKD